MPHSLLNHQHAHSHFDIPATEPNEIYLMGKRLPITSPITRFSISPFAGKTTQGDYTREDRIIEAEWVVSDLSGGLGIRDARAGRDDDRYEEGTLDPRYRYLTLPPEVVQAGTLAGPASLMIDFNENLYVVVGGGAVWRWDNVSAWVQEDVDPGTGGTQSLSGTPRSACVHDGNLFILTSTTLYRYTGSTWSSQAVGGYALVSHDDKLWRLGTDNSMNYSSASPWTAWTAAGRLLLPAGYCKQLIVFWDQTGLPAIHAVTRLGLYGYDQDTARFVPAPLRHPLMASAGEGAAVWQGSLYVPVGSSIRRYNGATDEPAGPDRDEGLPVYLQGNIKQVVPSHGLLYCVVQATEVGGSVTQAWELGNTIETDTFWEAPGLNGAVLVSPGRAWHITSQHLSASEMGAALAAGLSTSYRLWWSTSQGIFYQTLPTGTHNPLNNPTSRYAASGSLDTPWNDLRWAEVDKVAFSLDVEADGLSSTEKISVYLAFDGDEEFDLALTATENGRTIVTVGGDHGQIFRRVKMRIVMERGSDATKTPRLLSAALGYFKVPDGLNSWSFTLDLTEPRCTDEIGEAASDLVEWLYEVKQGKKAGLFAYRPMDMEPLTRKVWLHEIKAVEQVAEVGGKYSVTLLELDRAEET